MTMQAQSGMDPKITYEVRSGKCPKCGAPFDDKDHPMKSDSTRWCPRCQAYKLGELKQTGIVKGRR
jgi:predicted Zn-ribbon and HTH transcriptional regulator